MSPEQIQRCAEGAPPPAGMEHSEVITFLAQEVLLARAEVTRLSNLLTEQRS